MNVATTWEGLLAVPWLEEADDDTRTAAFRVHGRTVTAALAGEHATLAGEPEAVATVAAALGGAAPAPPAAPATPVPSRRGRWVAVGVAAAAVAVAASRRRR